METQDSIMVDQFGSFMGSEIVEKLDVMLTPETFGLNQKTDMAVDLKGDAESKMNGIQVMKEQQRKESSLRQVQKRQKL